MSQNNTINASRPWLGFFGLIPFLGFSILALLDIEILSIAPLFGFISYSTIILSFLSGSLWGRTLSFDGTKPTDLIIVLSNIFSLSAWFCLLLYQKIPTNLVISILLIGFILLLVAEHKNKQLLYGPKAQTYLKVRNYLTAVVSLTHISVLIF